MAGEITVTSDHFHDDGTIPTSAAHTYGGGENRSPHLAWAGLPEGTKSVAVTIWDPDAPTGIGFVHWVRFDIPPDVTSFDEGAGTEDGPWVDGFTDWGETGYGGMAPPPGDEPHRYIVTVYALGTESLGLDGTTTYAKFKFMSREHLLGTGTITGRFGIDG